MALIQQASEAASKPGQDSDTKAEISSKHTEIMKKHFSILSAWIEEQNKLLDEMNKVRLVASPKVADLLDDYSEAVQPVIESTIGLPIEFALSGPQRINFETVLNYGQLMQELKRIKSELHTAMREDIGIE